MFGCRTLHTLKKPFKLLSSLVSAQLRAVSLGNYEADFEYETGDKRAYSVSVSVGTQGVCHLRRTKVPTSGASLLMALRGDECGGTEFVAPR